ncbi:MAG: recombinase family protein, partial [Gammaproteobacteria bacterium]|nr:recombinase family protein [Gammaproteobacteria bacterium]
RNRHRLTGGAAWQPTAVRAILDNPRYTGYQVWNRQRRDEVLINVHDVGLGYETRMRRNDPTEWIWSNEPSHEPLITRQQYDEVQERFHKNRRTSTRQTKTGRRYLLAGRIRCGQCGRRMEGAWNHDRPYYRCQVHRNDKVDRNGHAATIYVREEALLPGLDEWLGELFDTGHLDDTCRALAQAAQPDPDDQARHDKIRKRITKLDRELDGYRSIVRNEPEAAATVERWIAETTQERRRLETFLGVKASTRLTKDDIKALVASLRDITATLADADPTDKAAVYEEMGIDVTYHQDGQVLVESRPRVVSDGVGGGT